MSTENIELSRKYDFNGQQVETLQMREPTVADQLVAGEYKGTDAEQEVIMVANLCDVAPDNIKKLTLKDYKRLQSALVGFTE